MDHALPTGTFPASNVYKVAGADQYLLLQEAIGNSTGRRYFRSFTSTSLTGSWTPLADTWDEPFAGRSNVTFPGGAWTQDISHGEMVRAGNDQTLPIDPCHMQYVYQGMDPNAGGDYLATAAGTQTVGQVNLSPDRAADPTLWSGATSGGKVRATRLPVGTTVESFTTVGRFVYWVCGASGDVLGAGLYDRTTKRTAGSCSVTVTWSSAFPALSRSAG